MTCCVWHCSAGTTCIEHALANAASAVEVDGGARERIPEAAFDDERNLLSIERAQTSEEQRVPTRRAAAHGRDGHAQARQVGSGACRSGAPRAPPRSLEDTGSRRTRSNEVSNPSRRAHKEARSPIFISDLQSPISWGRRVRGGIDVLPRCSFPFTPSSGSPPSFRAILQSPVGHTILEAPLARSQHLRLRPEISRTRYRWRQLKISIFS